MCFYVDSAELILESVVVWFGSVEVTGDCNIDFGVFDCLVWFRRGEWRL